MCIYRLCLELHIGTIHSRENIKLNYKQEKYNLNHRKEESITCARPGARHRQAICPVELENREKAAHISKIPTRCCRNTNEEEGNVKC